MGSKRCCLFLAFFLLSFSLVQAWEFNGTVFDINGTALNNSIINVTIRDQTFQVVGYNSTFSNLTGWFNLTVSNDQGWFYEPSIIHFQNNATDGSTPVDFIGQSLPSFSFFELQNGLSTNFYLREAGTINITVVNATGSPVNFSYMVKDQTLGFPISQAFTQDISQKSIYVPKDRNYSVMIFPNAAMPVSFDWNNFSAASDYNIGALSNYNATTSTLSKQFNATDQLLWVSGYALNTTAEGGYGEFTIIPFILEPGSMLFLGNDAGMPYNMSVWRSDVNGSLNLSDQYNLTSGFYNITLPGPNETANLILFATAKGLDGKFYGGYRNISLGYSDIDTTVNFTMYPLMSIDWASQQSNFTMKNAVDFNNINISTARQAFNLVNSTGFLSGVSSHIEVTVDYTNYNATEFTFMLDTSQSGGTSSFYVPLINTTGIKEANIYSQMYAPKRLGTLTAAEIISNNNVTLSSFQPGDIEGGNITTNLKIALFKSNSTCDVPNPDSNCVIGSSDPDSGEAFGEFNPLKSIIGGGKLSFRMGLFSSGIIVHYVNVDMLASGPPDALFDDSATTSTSDDFESALRFGSQGPTIYDYVLVSIPYAEGSGSQTGLNESGDVNLSIPFFYAENVSGNIDWGNPIWNSEQNGTNATFLGGNYSHYSDKASQWQTLMNNNTCLTNVSVFNATNPCYIDKTNNRIWIRLPHFSGTKPSIVGSVISASPEESSSSSGSGGPSTQTISGHTWASINPGDVAVKKDFNLGAGIKEIQIEVNNKAQNVKITVTKYDGKPAAVSVEKSGKVYRYLQIKTENLEDKLKNAKVKVQVDKNWTTENSIEKNDVSLFKFNETSQEWVELTTNYLEDDEKYSYYEVELKSFSYFAIGEKDSAEEQQTKTPETGNEVITNIAKSNKTLVISIIVIIILLLAVVWYWKRNNY